MQHADLNGAKTAAAGEHKGGFRWADLVAYRQRALPRRRVGNRPRGVGEVIAAGEWGGLLAYRGLHVVPAKRVGTHSAVP